ncbi:hypothetical protein BJ508DRAFT_313937 [Ascobolus immersus RN42]|uniref:Uncharacterized protein n=1 Tax=Ascobolus immersus RN42 TaxID=1160509 RepID=A0A3N4HGY8_ASCIM|nr:hypothetical protein BJ508DRAFT_313937 [Ascobolus immersus RN42]
MHQRARRYEYSSINSGTEGEGYEDEASLLRIHWATLVADKFAIKDSNTNKDYQTEPRDKIRIHCTWKLPSPRARRTGMYMYLASAKENTSTSTDRENGIRSPDEEKRPRRASMGAACFIQWEFEQLRMPPPSRILTNMIHKKDTASQSTREASKLGPKSNSKQETCQSSGDSRRRHTIYDKRAYVLLMKAIEAHEVEAFLFSTSVGVGGGTNFSTTSLPGYQI